MKPQEYEMEELLKSAFGAMKAQELAPEKKRAIMRAASARGRSRAFALSGVLCAAAALALSFVFWPPAGPDAPAAGQSFRYVEGADGFLGREGRRVYYATKSFEIIESRSADFDFDADFEESLALLSVMDDFISREEALAIRRAMQRQQEQRRLREDEMRDEMQDGDMQNPLWSL